MDKLIKPKALQRGDTVAAVSLSWGGAGDEAIVWRYNLAKQRLQQVFGLHVVEMPHTLKGTQYVYQNPQKRAEDLMQAFADPQIKAVIACIGGNDSIRMLPYINFDVIRSNPKLFSGYSDSIVTHFMCLKAGLASVYGPAMLTDFAENGQMFEYTVQSVQKTWFTPKPIGSILPAPYWTNEYLPWDNQAGSVARKTNPNTGYQILQGSGQAQGRLIGGCADVLEMLKGTPLFPPVQQFKDCILFLETSEVKAPPALLEDWLRWYATMGILQRVNGLVFGKPYENMYYEEYKEVIKKVLAECGCQNLPVLYNASFGHAAPLGCMPMGALAQIDCDVPGFAILEAAVC